MDKVDANISSPVDGPAANEEERRQDSREELSAAFSTLVGEDPNFRAVLWMAQKVAQSDFSVLILGESGTGKEILARTIHQTSRRSSKNFVDINCAAIPDQLIDSELFGYEKGSFTGATQAGRDGLFIEAHQGTLFLDEIADASLQTQAKLLRVLNEGHFRRVGSTKNIDVDVRIIAATNKDLRQLIQERRFRDDLMYRLNTITIHLPALRERPKDIPLLAEHFLHEHAKQQQRSFKLAEDCLEILNVYSWPGNVRELKSVVDYIVTMATGPMIHKSDLPNFLLPDDQCHTQEVVGDGKESSHGCPDQDETIGLFHAAVQEAEMRIMKEVLAQAKNRTMAIRILGISRRTFYAKLKQYKLDQ